MTLDRSGAFLKIFGRRITFKIGLQCMQSVQEVSYACLCHGCDTTVLEAYTWSYSFFNKYRLRVHNLSQS